MRERKGKRNGAAESVSHKYRVVTDTEFLESVFDGRDISIHQRQQRGLRTVKSRQIDQRDAMLGSQRRKHGIEGKTISKQRMQQNQIRTFASAHRGKRAPSGAQLF